MSSRLRAVQIKQEMGPRERIWPTTDTPWGRVIHEFRFYSGQSRRQIAERLGVSIEYVDFVREECGLFF